MSNAVFDFIRSNSFFQRREQVPVFLVIAPKRKRPRHHDDFSHAYSTPRRRREKKKQDKRVGDGQTDNEIFTSIRFWKNTEMNETQDYDSKQAFQNCLPILGRTWPASLIHVE